VIARHERGEGPRERGTGITRAGRQKGRRAEPHHDFGSLTYNVTPPDPSPPSQTPRPGLDAAPRETRGLRASRTSPPFQRAADRIVLPSGCAAPGCHPLGWEGRQGRRRSSWGGHATWANPLFRSPRKRPERSGGWTCWFEGVCIHLCDVGRTGLAQPAALLKYSQNIHVPQSMQWT
jgi:hypothetical protein